MAKCTGCGEDFYADEMINTKLPRTTLKLCLECARMVRTELERPIESLINPIVAWDNVYNEADKEADETLVSHVNRRL